MKEPPHTDMSTPTTFEAHGHTWTKHTPGNPMPCKPDTLIFTLFKCEFEKGIIEVPASNPDKWKWQEIDDDYSIIGWRFATPPQEKGELATLRAVVSACMKAMPCGNIATHTPENLAGRIEGLAQSLATESLENETLRAERDSARLALQAHFDHFREWSIPGPLYNQVQQALKGDAKWTL